MDEIKVVKIDQIKISPFQPRKNFSSDELQELASSILTVGLIHPPTVRVSGNGSYELISGERRLKASLLAGLLEIPVVVKKVGESESAHAALIENIQRVDLNPLEVARALKNLAENHSYSQEELALKIGKKRSTVANYLRLLSLPETIQKALKEDLITMGHAKALLSVTPIDQQMALFDWIVRQALSVRASEEAAKLYNEKSPLKEATFKQADLFLCDLEKSLSEEFSTRVTVTENKGKGAISLQFYSLDDLDRLLQRLR